MSSALSRKIWRIYLYPVRSYWHFYLHNLKMQDGGRRHLGFLGYVKRLWRFQVMWIWLFWRVDSVVFVLCTKFGSRCYSHRDRRTDACDIYLMTSRELTSGFDFWSCGHLRMAVMHLPIKFGAYIFIQSGVIDIFPKFKMDLGFVGGAMGPPTKAYSWSVLPVKISTWSAK